jgi:hypothetical protein
MLRTMPVLLVVFMLLCPSPGHGAPSEPSNYDECILDAMRGVSSDVAARAIIASCENLFPEPQPEAAPQAAAPDAPVAPDTRVAPLPADTANARSLTDEELARLNATAKVFGSTYRVTVSNGNPDLTLTEVTIAVWDDNDPASSRKEYREAVEIAPRSSAMVKYVVHYRGDETGWNWGVVAARGAE